MGDDGDNETTEGKAQNRNIPAQELTSDASAHAGYMKKYNPRGRVQNRYCIIHKGYFYYYKDCDSKKTQGYFRMAGYLAEPIEDKNVLFKFKMEPYHNKTMRSYAFRCASQSDLDFWVRAINSAVLTFWPDSLYPEDFRQSADYEYIAKDLVCVPPAFSGEFTSTNKIGASANYKGPTLGSGPPKWVIPPPSDDAPEIPEKPDYVTNFTSSCNTMPTLRGTAAPQPPPRPSSSSSLPRLKKKPVLTKDNTVDCIDYPIDLQHKNEMSAGYMTMKDVDQQKNELTDYYQPMQDLQTALKEVAIVHDSDTSDDEGPYVDLENYENEDDEDAEDDSTSEWPALPPQLHSPSNVVINVNEPDVSLNKECNEKEQGNMEINNNMHSKFRSATLDDVHGTHGTHATMVYPVRDERSMSLPVPTTHPPRVVRGLTFPEYGSEIIEEYPQEEVSGRAAFPPPLSPRMRRRVNEDVDVDALSDSDVIPTSCLHENLERDQCIGLLCLHEVGTYLIRTAAGDSTAKVAVLARKSSPKVKHYIVFTNECNKIYLEKGEPTFDDLPALIKYYYKHNLPKTDFTLISPLSCKNKPETFHRNHELRPDSLTI